jgi:hypothetical protein
MDALRKKLTGTSKFPHLRKNISKNLGIDHAIERSFYTSTVMLPSDNSSIFRKNFVEKLKNGAALAKLWRRKA